MKLRDRLRLAHELAKTEGWCARLDWEEINAALPQGRPQVRHHPALPLAEVPRFYAELAGRESMAALCLRFVILTAARSGEARGATWAEIDREARVWRIPAERMKARTPHEVPLSDEAMAVLEQACAVGEARHSGSPWVFPSPVRGRSMTDVALSKLFRPYGCTAHGFRSAFRDWAAGSGVDREIAEACLSHGPQGGAVEAAYRRTSMIARKRAALDGWAGFVTAAALNPATT